MYSNCNLLAKFTFDNGKLTDQTVKTKVKIYGGILGRDRFGNTNWAYFLPNNFGSYINLGTNNYLKPKIGSSSLWVKINHPMPNGNGIEFNPIISTRFVRMMIFIKHNI